MSLFGINCFMAVVYAMAIGTFSGSVLVMGFVLGFIILWLCAPLFGTEEYHRKYFKLARFLVFYLSELVVANLRVAHDVITPRHRMSPMIIGIPLDAKTDFEITLLANLITLTPGTLAVDLSKDNSVLYIHEMYLDGNIEAYRKRIKEKFERPVLELLR